MPEELFYDVNLWLILVAGTGFFLLATEAGFLLGRRSQATIGDHQISQLYTIQARGSRAAGAASRVYFFDGGVPL